MSQTSDLQRSVFECLRPPPSLTVSQWADKNRQLSSEASSETGQWNTSRFEFTREVMDCATDPDYHTIVWMKSAQVGGTEVINNIVGYHVDLDPCPIIVVHPTLREAQDWAEDRFVPMVRNCKSISGKVAENKSRDKSNTKTKKNFPGGHLTVAGGNSPSGLAGRPIRVAILDDVDRIPAEAGGEGSPILLTFKRTRGFWNRKRILVSTPTVAGASHIETWFERSDKRYFNVKCPNCDMWQILKWANVKFDSKNFNVDQVHYKCSNNKCTAHLSDPDIKQMVPGGHWRKTAESNGIAGFHINELYSPNSSVNEIAEDFMRVRKNPSELKTFINTSLGELYDETTEEFEWRKLYQRREKYPSPVPQGVQYLTVGADLQADRAEYEVVGWGVGEESWSIDYVRLYGDIHGQHFWDSLHQMFNKTYLREDGIKMEIGLIGFDQQYQSDLVKDFSKKVGVRRLIPLVGDGRIGHPIAVFPRKRNRQGIYISRVGTDTAKTLIYGRYDLLQPGAGYCHYPIHDAYDEEFFKQATAEVRQLKYSRGNSYHVWANPKQKRNEPLDCRQNAIAALRIAQQHFHLDLDTLSAGHQKPAQKNTVIDKPPQSKDEWLSSVDRSKPWI